MQRSFIICACHSIKLRPVYKSTIQDAYDAREICCRKTQGTWDSAVSKGTATEEEFRENLFSLLVTIHLRNGGNCFPL
jgi:hypothetical protein